MTEKPIAPLLNGSMDQIRQLCRLPAFVEINCGRAWFSNSSLKAASQMSSDSGLASKASFRMWRAAGTSPPTHFSLAAMSQSTWARGQYFTASCSTASRLSGVPCAFSSWASRLRSTPPHHRVSKAW